MEVRTINLDIFYDIITQTVGSGALPFNVEQQQAVEHDFSLNPLWVVAGPGTGKTHTLTWLVFKRILVDGIEPKKIFLTTFTNKAAEELHSRLIQTKQLLVDAGLEEAAKIDVSHILCGTLHSLASKVLEDMRYDEALRIRILEDEITQQFFVRKSRNPLIENDDLAFWEFFELWNKPFPPNKATRAGLAAKLFNRVTEGNIDIEKLLQDPEPAIVSLAEGYQAYLDLLKEFHRTDLALLQKHLLTFLQSSQGEEWAGQGLTVIVDEYQDTNPIQETIYFALAKASKDITVVGDDDQSLYRFRGATVDSLLNFDKACEHYLNCKPAPIYLHENRRSHPRIVEFVNQFIKHHPEMQDPNIRVRAPGKPEMTSAASVTGTYPAVASILHRDIRTTAVQAAELVRSLKDNNLIEDYGQVAFLTFTTRETVRGIQQYTDSLAEVSVPYYNPRNKQAHRAQLVQALIGALSHIINPERNFETLIAGLPRGVVDFMNSCEMAFTDLIDSGNYPELERYLNDWVHNLAKQKFNQEKTNYLSYKKGQNVTLLSLLYRVMAFEPFATALTEPEAAGRLKVINTVLSEYESMYNEGHLRLKQLPSGECVITDWDLYNVYAVFVEGIHDGLSDPEDEAFQVQSGAVNIMTIHQSKGLEFEVVFVIRPDKQPFVSDTHRLEELLLPYIDSPSLPTTGNMRSAEMRAAEDTIRLFFVAYSRAKRLLFLTGKFAGGQTGNAAAWQRVLGFEHGAGEITKIKDFKTKLGVEPI
ncbi:UvrD-helicase domain-containing protein [Shewanella sp. 10N.286.51.B8]|uniref:UvrD-helicase domain-containing protein n=1 Tax=Shewanella sp. 10N.286.51.B8 TaxID=3229708 RepID=UPI00354ED8C3